jgi:hypothetical protein
MKPMQIEDTLKKSASPPPADTHGDNNNNNIILPEEKPSLSLESLGAKLIFQGAEAVCPFFFEKGK